MDNKPIIAQIIIYYNCDKWHEEKVLVQREDITRMSKKWSPTKYQNWTVTCEK